MVDTINNKGEKFDENSLLKLPALEQLKEIAENNFLEKGKEIIITKQIDNNFLLTNYACKILVSDFTKTFLTLKTTDKVIVALDGVKIKDSFTTSDSLSEENLIKIPLNLEPKTYILSFSFLSSKENKEHLFSFNIEDSTILVGNNNLKYGLTLEEMLTGTNIYTSLISPSGKYSLIKYYNTNKEGKNSYGYIVLRNNINNSEFKKEDIIYKGEGHNDISWMKYGNKHFSNDEDLLYYFLSKDENRQLVTQTISGLTNIFLENLPLGDINLSALDDDILIISREEKNDNSKDDLRRYILPDDRINGWRNRTFIYLYDINSKVEQPLTFGYHSTYFYDYNKKTNKLMFFVSYDDITKRPFTLNSLYEIDIKTFNIDTIIKEDGFFSYAKYIPNTDKIIAMGSAEAFSSIGNTLKKGVIPNAYHNMLFILDQKTKEIECITKFFNPSISNMSVTENGEIFFSAENKDSLSLYQYDLNKKEIKQLELNIDVLGSFSLSSDGKTIGYVGQNYNTFPSCYIYTNGRTQNIYKEKTTSSLALGDMKVWNFTYKNNVVEGRYYLPHNFDSTKTYPMIVYYYGGTSPTDRSFAMRYSAYLYTAQGYVVYVLNPSGTTGYGQLFASYHVNAWGEKTADEIIFGVELFTKEHSFIDKTKIGCIGASYGGFMTQLLQTKTDIFACAISHAGISDITSYWGEGYWGYSYSSGATANSYPWNRKDIYVERSPLFKADKIKTPILLLHGDSDTNVPIGESIQLFNALKILGRDVEFISVKGENHGIVDYKKRLKWNNTIFAYFAKYLKNQSLWWDELYPTKTNIF
jgi:dipeptidyl aminopeptidase/acylaminoacyl peptidase